MDKRIRYFDIAKGFGILLVVLGHLEYIPENLRYFIVSFHMPLFFVVSGMLMRITGEEERAAGVFIRRKLLRMGLPYVSYTLAFLAIQFVYGHLTHSYNGWVHLQNAWQGLCLYGISVLWFLPAMFFGMLMLYGLRRRCSHVITIVMVILLAVVSYFLSFALEGYKAATIFDFWLSELYFPMAMVLRNFIALFYLAAGYYARFVMESRQIRMPSPFRAAAGAALLAAVACLSQVNGAVDIHFMIFGNPLIYLFNSLAGSAALILISSAMEGWSDSPAGRAVMFYGENSLTVMATHMDFYVMYVSIIFVMHLIEFIPHGKGYLFCPLIAVCVFALEYVIIRVINRFFPFFTGGLRVKRK